MRFPIRSILLIGALLAACGDSVPQPPAHIVLLTLPGLGISEADELPRLRELISEADWSGKGVSASSHIVPAAASLFTGLSPWNHQVLHAGQSRLRADLRTLPEALGDLGYESSGFSSNPWTSWRRNYGQGFDHFQDFSLAAVEKTIAQSDGQHFFWIQLRMGGIPQGRRSGPQVVDRAAIDTALSEVLAVLESSDSWPRTLLIVTAEHGSSNPDEQDRSEPLERRALEVPIVVRLPENSNLSIASGSEETVALARLWATLVEAAGGHASPALAPSLFHAKAPPIVSELYRVQGANYFSLLDGNLQCIRRAAFLPEGSSPRRLLRQASVFDSTRPFTGLGTSETILLRWEKGGGTKEVTDEAMKRSHEIALGRRWLAFVDLERTPSAELALRPSRPTERSAAPRSGGQPKEPLDH